MTVSLRFRRCVLLLLAAGAAAAQEPPPKPKWPELTSEQRIALDRALQELRKSEAALERERAIGVIEEIGAAAAPQLLRRLGEGKHPELAEDYTSMLDHVTAAEHAPLIIRELDSKSLDVRAWAVRRLAQLDAREALAKIQALQEKEKDEDLSVWCAIARVRFGDLEAMPAIEKLAVEDWIPWRDEAHVALTKVRGAKVTERALSLMRHADRAFRLGGLRILAGGGERSAIPTVRPYLDSTDRGLQEAAVNALRGIVDGAAPRYEIPVFQLIELAEQWKQKISKGL